MKTEEALLALDKSTKYEQENELVLKILNVAGIKYETVTFK